MELESRPATAALTPAREPPGPADKVRLRFRKDGPLRLLSHHDLMRTFERMLRRAALPFRSSQGFHPKPRIIFALSLPLGVVGVEEVAELELDDVLPITDVSERLSCQAPPGLQILSVKRVGPRVQAQVHRLCYRLPIPDDRLADLATRLAAMLAAPECWVERTRPPARRVDVRPFLSDLRLVQHAACAPTACPTTTQALEMELWLTPAGTARPEELLTLLGIQDLLDAGAVLERSRLELQDESSPLDAASASTATRGDTAMSAVGNTGHAPYGASASLAAFVRPNTSTEGSA